MDWQDRIVFDPEICFGKPTVKGTRITVDLVIELMADGWGHDKILRNYPRLTREDIQACLGYVSDIVKDQVFYPSVRR